MKKLQSNLPFGHQLIEASTDLCESQFFEEKRYKAVLCFGSNMEDASLRIGRAWKMLESQGCKMVKCTEDYASASGYSNRVAEVSTALSYDKLKSLTKQVELLQGREPWMKEASIVPIDIDIVIFDGCIMRQQDYSAAYFQIGLDQLKARD